MTTTDTTTHPSPSHGTDPLDRERTDLLESLGRHRFFLRYTVRGLTDEQARLRPTVSELCLGGIVKHVAATEATWADFMVRGAAAFPTVDWTSPQMAETWAAEHHLLPEETLAGVLEHYAAVAAHTDDLVRTLPSLDADHLLPKAPWFTPGGRQSARRTLLHLIAETAQHAGHADVIRETLDGQKTMG
ncbi:DinB family protein [Modestobacter muralis]|uniref:DinB family protein n=1 Tax=Modestobacter muralis TaxID=1608614 RepID=A0A6P0EXY5_9ACTN|nr:DinB family protein [Modestobacter muralis]NEK95396.1 DinB family protein [Modestobacter muralis]NEN52284.1 DinB family protein [Modestobacter muralis]